VAGMAYGHFDGRTINENLRDTQSARINRI
jgi:hypothetical protein